MEYIKTKSASKLVYTKSELLDNLIAKTTATCAKIVGGTLGPGGHPVIIERQEYNIPPLVTKDGVTVFRSLGFTHPVSQACLELLRDTSVRTASEAGDGTTTATILADAIYRFTRAYCNDNPTVPGIQVIRTINKILKNTLLPAIDRLRIVCDFGTEEGKALLAGVAAISGNGDKELADAVMKCFEICGDEGNVTIIESTGPSGYEVEKIEGYPVASGYEKSCAKFYPMFINEPGTQKVIYEKPVFVLYFGRIIDIQTILPMLQMLQQAWNEKYLESPNVVLVATGFSENVLANLANMAVRPDNINVFPLATPDDVAVQNAQRHFLDDLAAVTGTEVFDPLTKPLSDARLIDLGNLVKDDEGMYRPLGVKFFEATRYRSTVVGHCDDEILLNRVEVVKAGVETAESEYDRIYIQERLAKLSNGIAKLKVIGASNGELKERRDRAEDAVCAVRGAIKNGALIGGGWTIKRLIHELEQLKEDSEIATQILAKSLNEVIQVLYLNAGFSMDDLKPADAQKAIGSVLRGDPKKAVVLDLSSCEIVSAFKIGLLDSAPALEEALKNSISAAALLGTTGGCVVFPKDEVAEHQEARDAQEFERFSKDFVDERAI